MIGRSTYAMAVGVLPRFGVEYPVPVTTIVGETVLRTRVVGFQAEPYLWRFGLNPTES